MHFSVRGTVQTGQESLDIAISDLALFQSGASVSVFATSGPNGGLSSYTLTETGLAAYADSALFNPSWASGITDSIALLDDGYGGARLVFGRTSATGLGSVSVASIGTIGGFETLTGLFSGIDPPSQLAAFGSDQIVLGGSIGFSGYTLTGLALSQDFTATDSADTLIAAVSALALVQAGGQPILIAASGSEDGITSYLLTDTGPVLADVNGPDQGLGIMHPTAMATATIGSTPYLVVASAQDASGALSVFEVGSDGSLTATDHVLDTLATRFGGVQDVQLVTHGAFTYVVAGGGDDGVSLFQLLADGHLQLIDSIADTLTIGLSNVSAIAATAIGNTLRVLVASQSEGRLTDLAVDLSAEGVQHVAGPFGDTLNGTGLDDVLIGGAGNDQLFGGGGADILVDGAGQDALTGGAGADVFVLRADGVVDRVLDFDPTKDLFDLSAWPMFHDPDSLTIATTATGATIIWRDETLSITSLTQQPLSVSQVRSAVILGIDRPMDLTGLTFPDDGQYDLTGTSGDDVLRGGPAGETIAPGLGDDTVWAGGGDDIVFDGAGTNTIHLEDGNDVYSDRDASMAGDGDTIYGEDGNDRITTGIGADTVYGGADDDVILTGAGNDTVTGNRGADWIEGQTGNDTLRGGSGRDWIYGGNGRDYIFGGLGDDMLYGSNGNDRLWGEDGNDILRGQAGDDRLRGGRGEDTFVFAHGEGNDRLYNFQKQHDLIRLIGIDRGDVSISHIQDGTLISWHDGSVLLLGIEHFSSDAINFL